MMLTVDARLSVSVIVEAAGCKELEMQPMTPNSTNSRGGGRYTDIDLFAASAYWTQSPIEKASNMGTRPEPTEIVVSILRNATATFLQ